jgi:hypothetical protein
MNKNQGIIFIFTFFLLLPGLIIPSLSFCQAAAPPETLEETKKIGEKALEDGERELPGIMQTIWKQDVLPIYQKSWHWLKINIWSRIENWIMPEFQKRKQYLEQGFEKEKEEIKEEIKTEAPKISKSLWERLKELIR